MADISSFLQKILQAVYGEEVRGSIHDALAAMNKESSSAMEYAKTAQDSAAASAEKAKAEADIATTKSEEASDSAGRALTSETNAKSSETAAKESSDAALTAAEGAKASGEAAANSESVAIQKAQEAETSKNAAALSESEAKAAEERAKTVRSEVETLGAQAAADAKTAQDAKVAAEEARDGAVVSETNAKGSETAALDAKAAAETARDEALASKTSAEEDALAAAQSKEDAEAAKLAAETARDAAATSAQEAATSEASAKQYSGKPPMPQDGTWWIWNAETGVYEDTKISCELVGPIGVGIEDIRQTSGDHSPGTSDVYTVYLTDGSTYTISVYNGRNGEGAGDVLGISFDLVLPMAGWSDGSITVADNRLFASSIYKYILSAYDDSRTEFIECNVQPKHITTDGFLSFTCESDPQMDITINLIRLELSGNGAAQ